MEELAVLCTHRAVPQELSEGMLQLQPAGKAALKPELQSPNRAECHLFSHQYFSFRILF